MRTLLAQHGTLAWFLAGCGLAVYGVWLASPAAALTLGGALLATLAWRYENGTGEQADGD